MDVQLHEQDVSATGVVRNFRDCSPITSLKMVCFLWEMPNHSLKADVPDGPQP